jgi:hypothetical protein
MKTNKRYHSGTSLVRTRKETQLDNLESHIGELTDDVYLDMMKLRVTTIAALIKIIQHTEDQP